MQTQGRTFLLNAYGDHFDDRISNQKTSDNLEVRPKVLIGGSISSGNHFVTSTNNPTLPGTRYANSRKDLFVECLW